LIESRALGLHARAALFLGVIMGDEFSFLSSGDGVFKLPPPPNEPILSFSAGSKEKQFLKKALYSMSNECIDIPCIIGGREIRTGRIEPVAMPHCRGRAIAMLHTAGEEEIRAARAAALAARYEWMSLPWHERAAVFMKAADLLADSFRHTINASTMLGQSKNAYQAEIDASCELIDFLRFNAHFYRQILEHQPQAAPGMWNRTDYRPLEGFVLAVSPFNFTSIGGNLVSAPALVGNTVVWKPARTAVLSAYYIMKLFEAAGLPPGVINFIPSEGRLVGDVLLTDPDLAGVHFTGSTAVFQSMVKTVGNHIGSFRNYPRLVGETGGKDFIFAHASADKDALVTAAIRGAFEYQGQKCSAASRMYVPSSLWKDIKDRMIAEVESITMGEPSNFTHFMNAVIDRPSFENINFFIEHARSSQDAHIIAGGTVDDSVGYYVRPTVIEASSPTYKSMVEEIFGPVLTVYVYEDDKLEEALDWCDTSTPYGLTGGIFCQDRAVIHRLTSRLRFSAGNFYINDKPTGAVVGQQPFGGGRASGTNDKAGSSLNLLRWMMPRTIKENFAPPKDWRYPLMQEE
jgi:1-pyrroline-5-carboxylate dehydrogenase